MKIRFTAWISSVVSSLNAATVADDDLLAVIDESATETKKITTDDFAQALVFADRYASGDANTLDLDAGDNAWTLQARQDGLGFPVSVFRPAGADSEYPVAVDLFPKGTPSDFLDHGVAWVDLCTNDIEADTSGKAARVGVFANGAVEFGSRAWDGSGSPDPDAAGPVYLRIGANTVIDIEHDDVTILPRAASSTTNAAGLLKVSHSDSGSSAYAGVEVLSNTVITALRAFSSTYSFDSGSYQNTSQVAADGAGGLVLSAGNAAGRVSLLTGGSARSTQTRLEVGPAGDIWLGTQAALATNATAGFVHVRGGAGAPTGAPANTKTGLVPMYVDTTNLRVYFRIGATWRLAQLT